VRPASPGAEAGDELLLDPFPNLEPFPADRAVLIEAAGLRARHRLKTPDAMLRATGLPDGARPPPSRTLQPGEASTDWRSCC
jgi:hypothetical protein